jgi:hypothetical protein
VRASFFNSALEPINDADIQVTLTHNETQQQRTFVWAGRDYEVDFGILPEGAHSLTATVNYGNEKFVKRAQFVVRKLQTEQFNTTANWAIMQKMAALTSGQFFTLDQQQDLIDALTGDNQVKPLAQSREKKRPIISEWWLLAAILTLLTTEWAVRIYGSA